MNIELLLKLLQNPQTIELLRPILTIILKNLVDELNKPEVQKQIVDAIIDAITPNK
jgi:hypothetical protein